MPISKSIRNEADYDAALKRVTLLMDDPSGPDGQIDDENHPSRVELDALVAGIEAYESIHHPIELSGPAVVAEG